MCKLSVYYTLRTVYITISHYGYTGRRFGPTNLHFDTSEKLRTNNIDEIIIENRSNEGAENHVHSKWFRMNRLNFAL